MSLTHCNGSPYLYHQCVSGRLSFVLAHGLCYGLFAASVWEDLGSSRPSRPGTASFHCCTCSPSCRPARVHSVPPHRDCTCIGDSPGCQTFAVLLETCGPFWVPWFLHLVHLSQQESSHLDLESLVWWTSRNTLEPCMVYQMKKHRVEPCKHRLRGSPDLLLLQSHVELAAKFLKICDRTQVLPEAWDLWQWTSGACKVPRLHRCCRSPKHPWGRIPAWRSREPRVCPGSYFQVLSRQLYALREPWPWTAALIQQSLEFAD